MSADWATGSAQEAGQVVGPAAALPDLPLDRRAALDARDRDQVEKQVCRLALRKDDSAQIVVICGSFPTARPSGLGMST